MKYLFVFLLVGLNSSVIGQNRYHVDETTARDCDYGFYPFKCPVVLKTTQKPITGIIYFERSNGEWCESHYRDGKLNGISRVWYEKDGQLRNEKRYAYGIISGPDKAWHQNGQLWLEYNRMGASEEFHGLQREWYTNGQLERERTYINGKKDGLCRKWGENGELWYEEKWKDGVLISE